MVRKSYANPIDPLLVALRLDRRRWVWLLLIVIGYAALSGLGDAGTQALRYDRAAVAAGQWWRLWSAHIVHADRHHLALNALGLVLMWALFADDYRPTQWLAIVAVSAPAIGVGLYLADPALGWYLGASGILHASLGAGCVRHLFRRDWDRYILSAGLLVKLCMEQYAAHGGIIAKSGQLPVIVDAHLFGAIAGAALGLIFCRRAAIIAAGMSDRGI